MRKFTSVKLKIILTFTLLLLIGGSYFGFITYQSYLVSKIYSPNEIIETPDFILKIAKTEVKPVNLPLDYDFVKEHGGLDKKEDCESMSKNSTIFYAAGEKINYGPSDSNICVRRNESRDDITKYSQVNKQFVINYKIEAKNNLDSSKLNISLIVDSGRKLNKQVEEFNFNQFFPLMGDTKMVLRGEVQYISSQDPYEYIPYFQSKIGEDINKGISREAFAWTDVRDSESSIDFKISYESNGKTYSRIVRCDI